MSTTALADNMSLQTISQLLTQGLSSDDANLISLDKQAGTHELLTVPYAMVQLDALLSLIVDIVVRETIVVDKAFMDTWTDNRSILSLLSYRGVVDARSIDVKSQVAIFAKQRTLDQLCATPSLQQAQREAEEAARRRDITSNGYHNAIVWGTAGNLGRSAVLGIPYSPHPQRGHLLSQTLMDVSPTSSVVDDVLSWIQTQRASLYASVAGSGRRAGGKILLPPIAVTVIEAAKDLDDIIAVALQLRDEYADLRRWLGEVQDAYDSGDLADIQKHRRLLESVEANLKGKADDKYGKTSLAIGVSWFKYTVPVQVNPLQRVGVRKTLNTLAMTRSGRQAIDKLLVMLGESDSLLGLNLRDRFSERGKMATSAASS
jgi:hypothetical protein